MTRVRVECFTISLDGYGAGPNQDISNPLGVAEHLGDQIASDVLGGESDSGENVIAGSVVLYKAIVAAKTRGRYFFSASSKSLRAIRPKSLPT